MSSNWVDFKALKTAVSMEMVLAHYSIHLHRVNQSSLRGKCPLPTHSSSQSDNTFSVTTEKNAWACQSQSCVAARNGKRGGNVIDLVARMESCSIRDAALKLAEWFNVQSEASAPQSAQKNRPASSSQLVAEKVGERNVQSTEAEPLQNMPLGFALQHIDQSHPYLAGRGITLETAQHFGIGFFSGRGSMAGRVVIPIHNREGEIVAYAGRSLDDSDPRYKLPPGFYKTLELFNLHRVRTIGNNYVIVVEGFFGTAKVHQAGYPSVVALMGSSLSEQQEKMLAEFSHIILMLDGDKAGREATPEIAQRLMLRTFVKVIRLGDGVQPDKLSTDEIKSILGDL